MGKLDSILRLALAGACATVITGCVAAQGNKEIGDAKRIGQLHVGQTTKTDARNLFGPPSTTDLRDNGDVVWKYAYVRTEQRATNFIPVVGDIAGGVDTQSKTLSLLFDSKGVLRNMDAGSSTGGGGGIQDIGK